VKKVIIQALVPPKIKEEILELATKNQLPVSEFVRRLISVALREKLYERF
jgi:hypothetical protein